MLTVARDALEGSHILPVLNDGLHLPALAERPEGLQGSTSCLLEGHLGMLVFD